MYILSEHVGTLRLSGVHAFLFPAPLYTTFGMVSRADPERRARIEQREQAIEAELTISQIREARGATQESVAERMNVMQSNVSHFERNPNIFLRSLAGYVEALGGQLEIRAVFPDQVVTFAVPGAQRQPSSLDPSQHGQAAGF